MNIRETAHTQHSGLIITSLNEGDVTHLLPQYLLTQLAEHGYIVLRGFQHSIDHFSRLVCKSSTRISLDPARSFNGNTAQKVDAGYDKVGLHCENGNSPFLPDLCWFYCQKAPEKGSQTTVCDGKLVYQYLDTTARAAFSSQDIIYSRRVEENKWKTFVYHSLASQQTPLSRVEDVRLEHLLSLVARTPGTHITLNDDGTIYYQFQTSAILASRINPHETHNFANSIFGPSNNYEKPVITFANGQIIPNELLAEVSEVCDRFTYDVGWQHGDIVLIDNTRVMHGRRQIEDKSRTIFNALSYIS